LPDKFSNQISISLVIPRSDFKTSAGDMQSYQYSLLRYILKQRLGSAMDWQFRADGQPMLNWFFETPLDWQKNKEKRPDHFKVLENFENQLATLIAKPLDQETLDLFKQEYLGSVQQWYATSRNQAKTEAELLQNAAQGLHPWIDTAGEWPLVQEAIAQVDSQRISAMLSGMAKGPRYIQVMQESSHLKTLPSHKQIVDWYHDYKPVIGTAASTDIRPMPLPAPQGPAGSISSEQNQGELQAFTLANGMKVFLRTMPQANHMIAFRMDAAGGIYQFGPDLYGAALAADLGMKNAIVAMIPSSELERTRLSKGIIFWPYVDADTHGLSGFSPLSGLDGAFSEIHHRFQRNEKTDLTGAIYPYAKADDKFENYQGLVNKLMRPAAFNDDYRIKLLDPQWGQQAMNYHRTLVYRQLWGDPAQFTLMVAGPVLAKELKPLLEKWLANIPKHKDSQAVVLAPFKPQAGGEQQVTDPRLKVAQDLIEFNSVQTNLGSGIAAHALILQAVLEERLRMDLREIGGHSYAPWAYIMLSPGPSYLARASIGFDIEPSSEEKALQGVKEIIKALRETPVSQKELQNAKQIALRELASEQGEAETLIRRLSWLNQAGMPLDGTNELRKQVEQCQAIDVQSAVKSLLAAEQMTVGRLTPNSRK
jgi:zinc protease